MAGLWSSRLIPAIRLMARRAAPVVLLIATAGCSQIVVPDNAAPGLPPPYVSLAANYLKSVLKDTSAYDGYEISGLRWVNTVKGWSWLACVRFGDHGHKRIYAIFIQDSAVNDARYAVETDSCETQTYTQFDLTSGVLGRPTGPVQQPLY